MSRLPQLPAVLSAVELHTHTKLCDKFKRFIEKNGVTDARVFTQGNFTTVVLMNDGKVFAGATKRNPKRKVKKFTDYKTMTRFVDKKGELIVSRTHHDNKKEWRIAYIVDRPDKTIAMSIAALRASGLKE